MFFQIPITKSSNDVNKENKAFHFLYTKMFICKSERNITQGRQAVELPKCSIQSLATCKCWRQQNQQDLV